MIEESESGAGAFHTQAPVHELQLMATVIRADGSVEDLGTIAYWHKSRVKRILHWLRNGKTGKITRSS